MTSTLSATSPFTPTFTRHRRLRRSAGVRALVRETTLSAADFVYPLFVTEGTNRRTEISSMPGQFQMSIDLLDAEMTELVSLGVNAVLLFGIPDHKDEQASGAYADDGVVQQAVRAIKRLYPEMVVITDVCNCEYTNHGHCGILVDGQVDNDLTLPILARTAVSHAAAGADIVAPSDMMDGRVIVLREALDAAGYTDVPVMSYAAKYASGFYGPFREAAGSEPSFGDRRSHQMDPANAREAMLEIETDLAEGADLIIAKPALSYLDIIRQTRDRFDVPIVAYNVSGEYAMVKAAEIAGWIDGPRVTLELLTSMKRAGADRIITYHAKEAARWLAEQG